MSNTIKLASFSKKTNSMATTNNWNKTYTTIVNREPMSIINPVFVINDSSSPFTYNYAYWEQADRYYFIDDIILKNESTYEVHCSIDVLATYRGSIRAYNCFCTRTSCPSYYNEYLEDGLVENVNFVQTKRTSVATDFDADDSIVSFRVAGADSSGSNIDGFSQFCVKVSHLNSTMRKLMDISGLGTISQVADDLLNSQWSPFKYILSAKQIPISQTCNDTINVRVGVSPNLTSISNAKSIGATESAGRYFVANYTCSIPTPFHADFRATSPRFIQLQAYIPFIGLITIPPEYAKMDSLHVQYRVDLVTGDAVIRVQVVDSTYFNTIMVQTTNIANDIQVIGSNSNIGTNLLGSVPVIGNLLSGGSGSVFAPNFDSVGQAGSPVGATSGLQSIVIYLRSFASTDSPVNQKGKPCMQSQAISNLEGYYAEFLNPSVEPSKATKIEKDMINNYLSSGIYVT